MSFPRYPKYKASGVEWLGEVPEHWEVMAVKRCLRSSAGGTAIKGQCASEPAEGLIPAFSASGQDVWVESADYEGAALVLSAVGARCGKTFRADGRWGVVANTHCLFPLAKANRDFFWWLTNDENWWEKGGSAQPFVKVSESLQRHGAVPPLAEQRAIAAFLDRETKKIDELVAEQERLIELLKEKRQAVISHAVTKGLDPAAPMKPSGVEWLGDVPAHWEVPALGYRYRVELGKMLDAKQISGNHLRPYVRNADVQWGRVNVEDLNTMDFAPDECDRFRLRSGDLLVCEGGEVGRCAVWTAPIEECYYQKAIHRLRPLSASRDDATYMRWVLDSAVARGCFASAESKATIAHLPAETFRRHRFGFPPLQEQLTIVAFLDRETAKIDTLVAQAESAISLLTERRSALISAAVTGQIDVRNAVPSATPTEAA
jgi:type I restriction enzyme S subunit